MLFVLLLEIVSPTEQTSRGASDGVIVLRMWQNGFTLNDGELRSYSDPANREFLESIKRGEVPAEIRQKMRGSDLRLDMEDHRHEDYIPPKPKVKAFTGKGQMLGR